MINCYKRNIKSLPKISGNNHPQPVLQLPVQTSGEKSKITK